VSAGVIKPTVMIHAAIQQAGTAGNANAYGVISDPAAIWRNRGLVAPAGFEPLSTSALPAPNLPATITGTFTGNSNADGPFVYTGCIPGRIQYGTVDVLYQDRFTQNNVDFLSNGFKVRSTTSNSGTVNYTVTTTHTGGEYAGKQVPFGGAGRSPATAVSN
jgi:hypothetical protein